MENEPSRATVRTTGISLAVVDALVEKKRMRVEEIAEDLDIGVSTAHRHLQTLREYGYVVKEGRQYQLGFQFLDVGGLMRSRIPGHLRIKQRVRDLADETGERVQFIVEENGMRVFLYTENGAHAVKADARIGRRGPLHCSSGGKAILAEFPEERVRTIIDQQGLDERTDQTITDPDELFRELETIREQGVAFNREESTKGLCAVGSCVEGPNGDVLGSISVSGPAHRFTGEWFTDELPDLIRGVTQELELNIKYSTG